MAIQFNSNFNETVPVSDVCATINLAAHVAISYSVPGASSTKYQVRFTYTENSNVFVCNNPNTPATASYPSGSASSISTQQYNEFRPGCDGSKRYAYGGNTISFITPDTQAYVGITLSQLPG